MLRKIILVRHAHAEIEQFGLNDRNRVLTHQGISEIHNIFDEIHSHFSNLQMVLCSNAKRTRQTLDGLKLNVDDLDACLFEDDLYHCTSEILSSKLQTLDDSIKTVMIIAHNPGVSDFIHNIMSKGNPVHPMKAFPTCGVVILECDISQWITFDRSMCVITDTIHPKSNFSDADAPIAL